METMDEGILQPQINSDNDVERHHDNTIANNEQTLPPTNTTPATNTTTKPNTLNNSSSSYHSTPPPKQEADPNFTIIWHNLTYRVDSRPFYTKFKDKWLTRNSASSNITQNQLTTTNLEDGRCSSSGRDSCNFFGSRSTISSKGSKERVILNHVCGSAKSRQLTAIMGPSGAGKSSLLHCLFQNRSAGVTGRILVDSPRKNIKLKVCFIPQSDYLNEWLTVREDLIFVSKLKLARLNSMFDDNLRAQDSNTSPTLAAAATTIAKTHNGNNIQKKNSLFVRQNGNDCNTSLIDHEANALKVAELLGLDICLDVKIKNISGGQKKRLSIARELMSKPDILVLDEPTTGLDSLTCYKTVLVLKDLAHLSPHPMAVVVTIHQPQSEVFNLFDKTYFLSNTGRAIYEDNPKNAVEILNRVAKIQLPQPNYNPASFLIELASEEDKVTCSERLSKHQSCQFYDSYDISQLRYIMMQNKSSSSNLPAWNFCAIDQRNSMVSDTSYEKQLYRAAKKKSSLQGFVDDTITSSETTNNSTVNQGNNNNPSSPSPPTINQEISLVALSNSSYNINHSNNNINSSSKSGNYFISYQLSDCLSSHSSNVLQSFRHIFILTHRSWLSLIRNPTLTRTRLSFHILLPFLMMMVYGLKSGSLNGCLKIDAQLDLNDLNRSIEDGTIANQLDEIRLMIENICFYFILIYGFGINIISATASFYPLTMRMYRKEIINGLYSPAPYFIGQMLAELPLEIMFPAISVFLTYPLTGQLASFLAWRMIGTAYSVFLVTYSIHSLGLLCGSIFINNVNLAVLVGQVSLFPLVLLSGFIIRPSKMGYWMRQASYLSPFKLGLTAISACRYGFGVCECDEDLLNEDGSPAKMSGMSPRMKHVLQYLFPPDSTEYALSNVNGTSISNNVTASVLPPLDLSEVMDKLSEKFMKAQTFALDLKSCDDVKPYILHVFQVENKDLFISIGILILIISVLKIITFSIMKSFPYRMS